MSAKIPKSGFAITSLILGLLSFIPLFGVLLGILAIIFCFISLHEIKKTIRSGKRLAIAGLVLGVLGILFTVVIYGSLFYFGFVSKTGPFIDLKNQVSKQILTQDAGALELYKNKFGKYPASLEEVQKAGFQIYPTDHYLKPFYYKVSTDGKIYELRSLGADGIYGTLDDILPNQ